MITKRIGKIVEQCRRISMTTAHDVFAQYSGHVDSLRVCVYDGGYRIGKTSQRTLETIYAGDKDTSSKLNEIEQQLNTLESGCLVDDYDDLEREA